MGNWMEKGQIDYIEPHMSVLYYLRLVSACLRWLLGYENGRSAQIFAQPVNGLWQNLIN